MDDKEIRTEWDPSLEGYAVYRGSERLGHVRKVRSAVRRSNGNRVLSGKLRTVWVSKGYEYPTLKAAIAAVARRTKEEGQ